MRLSLRPERIWKTIKQRWFWEIATIPIVLTSTVILSAVCQTLYVENREDARQVREQHFQDELTREDLFSRYLADMTELVLRFEGRSDFVGDQYRLDGTSALGNSLANARTMATIPRLDAGRKALALKFLYNTGLLSHGEPFQADWPVMRVNTSVPIGVSLMGQDFSEVELTGSDFAGANLTGVNLKRTDLSHSGVSGVNFSDAILVEANLEGAFARGAHFERTDLTGANLRGIDVQSASFEGATLINADLGEARLVGTNFKGANLTGAIFEPFTRRPNDGLLWQNTTCPDGSLSEDQDGDDNTCWSNLRPSQ
jgi:uncharacterized protein YjbI with pentapeptide repeats